MKIQILKILFSFAFIFININLNSQTNYNKQIDDLQSFANKELIELKGDNINIKQTTKSNVTFTAMNVTGTAGNSVTIPIHISDVTDLASFQFTIEYDNTQLSYNSCNTWLVPGSVTIQEPSPGHLTFVWAVASGSNYSAGLFFNLVMNINASATGTLGIIFSDDPTARLIGNSASAEIPSSWINGSVNVSGTTNPSLTISDEITTISSSVTVPVNATDLYNLCAFQWTINYDASRLTFNNCSNWATGIDAASVLINDNGSGTITFAYNNYPNGIDIVNKKFFNLNFTTNTTTGVAPVTWSSSPTVQELSNSIPAEIIATWNNGSVTISSNPTIIIETVNGIAGNSVSVPVNALNLTNLCAFQWTIDYDETKLTYIGCSNWATGINTDPSYLLINDDGSKITFAYNDYPNTVSITNGKFFDLNFTINAAATGTAPVIWSDDPTTRELSDDVPNVITADWTDGAVIISQPITATITIEDVFGIAGNAVAVPVNALNLVNMAAFQWTIDYDETKLSYTGCSNWATGIDAAAVLINNNGTTGTISFAYNNYPSTLDITNGKFFDLNFTINAAATGTAPVIWSDSPTPREVSDDVPNVITVIWVDGSVFLDLNWDGSVSTDWQTVANWTPEQIPTSAVNAVIPAGCPNYPVITSSNLALCKNLSIASDASVTIDPNGKMTVSGVLTNNNGFNGLIIQSNATGDGSLIQNSTGVNATVKRYLANENVWHYISSPITSQSETILGVNGYYYDETKDDWWTGPNYYSNGASGWIKPTAPLTPAVGYIRYGTQTTNVHQGQLNAQSSYTVTCPYTSHTGNAANGDPYTGFDGWTLVGNPYTCALDWELIDKTNNVLNTVYYFNSTTNNYAYYQDGGTSVNGGTRYIPMGQSFFVKTDNTSGGSILISNTARVHYNQTFWKSNQSNTNSIVRIKVNENTYSDEALICINNNATDNIDKKYDAYKQYAWDETVPQIFTSYDSLEYQLAINSFNFNNFRKKIRIGYLLNTIGTHEFEISQQNVSNCYIIYHDKSIDTYKLLNTIDTVEFSNLTKNIVDTQLEVIFEQNIAPEIIEKLKDTSYNIGEQFNFSLPKNFYYDANIYDIITLSVKQSDGNELPSWINFNSQTLTFSGSSQTPQNINISVKVTDKFGLSASMTFNVSILKTALKINDLTNDVELYPNPNSFDYINVKFNQFNENYTLEFVNVTGIVVYQTKLIAQNNFIDISKLPQGIYMVKIKSEKGNEFFYKKIIRL